jgi:hypothetical protein
MFALCARRSIFNMNLLEPGILACTAVIYREYDSIISGKNAVRSEDGINGARIRFNEFALYS